MLTARQVLTLACRAEISVIRWRDGLPLDVGRRYRTETPALRRALTARDRGCRWPGCTAPTAWTEAHHLIYWWNGGPTDIDNLLLLCRWHHGLVHKGQWKLRLHHTTGTVEVTCPDGTPYELGPSHPHTGPPTR